MVAGAFPVVKLVVLAGKQLSKPIATSLMRKAKQHPIVRNYICIPPAKLYNWAEVKTKMWLLNLGKTVEIPPLTDTMAIELGANLLGELLVYSIGVSLLIFEMSRSAAKEKKKQQEIKNEKSEIKNIITEMGIQLEQQDAKLREMHRMLAGFNIQQSLSTNEDNQPVEKRFVIITDEEPAAVRSIEVTGENTGSEAAPNAIKTNETLEKYRASEAEEDNQIIKNDTIKDTNEVEIAKIDSDTITTSDLNPIDYEDVAAVANNDSLEPASIAFLF